MKKVQEIIPLYYYTGKIHKLYSEESNNLLKDYNVYAGEIGFLYYIYIKKNITQEELAQIMSINKATVTRTMNRLEKKELITRKQDVSDKRKKNIKLTQKGEKITEIIIKKQEEFEKTLQESFTDEEFNELKKYLDILIKKLEN